MFVYHIYFLLDFLVYHAHNLHHVKGWFTKTVTKQPLKLRMSSKTTTLIAISSVTAFVLWKLIEKRKEINEIERKLANLIKNYLSELQVNPDNKKELTIQSRKDVLSLESSNKTAEHTVSMIFGFPPNNELGKLMLEMLNAWNDIAFDSMCDIIKPILNKSTNKVRICEIGPGAGYDIIFMHHGIHFILVRNVCIEQKMR